MGTHIGIIIINWNGKNDTLACLNSLQHINYANFRIILVDNASTDGLLEIVKPQFPDVTLLRNEENLGFAEGNNVGIRYALVQGCDYILLLNNDTVVDPVFLTPLIQIGENNDNIGMLSAVIYDYHSPAAIWFDGAEINWRDGWAEHRTKIDTTDSAEKAYITTSDYLSGCALLVKKHVIETIGLLDTRFFAYYEDVDWCVRCKKAGWQLAIVPASKIWHKVGTSSKQTRFFQYRNVILFLWKHSTWWQFIVRVKRHIYRALAEYSWDRNLHHTSERLNLLDGVWAGLMGRYGNYQRKMPSWVQECVYRYIRYVLRLFR